MSTITSRRHAIVRQFRDAARGDGVHLLLDGWHLLAEALAASLPVRVIALAGDPNPAQAALLDRLARKGTAIARVSGPVLEAISPVQTPSGVVALADRRAVALDQLIEPAPALVVAAFGLQDPGNAGAVVRAAEAAGATGVLFDGDSADPFGWKALRASMGSALRLPVGRERDAHEILTRWRRDGLTVVLAEPQGGCSFREVSLTGPTVVVIGSEGSGVPAPIRALASLRATIPMRPPVESLNVAVATAILLYEAERQRR